MTKIDYELTTYSQIAWAYLQKNPEYKKDADHYRTTKLTKTEKLIN